MQHLQIQIEESAKTQEFKDFADTCVQKQQFDEFVEKFNSVERDNNELSMRKEISSLTSIIDQLEKQTEKENGKFSQKLYTMTH